MYYNTTKIKNSTTKNPFPINKQKSYIPCKIIGTIQLIIKYLFLNAIRSDYKIPIKVELRYLNGTDKGVEDYIIDNIITKAGSAKIISLCLFKYNQIIAIIPRALRIAIIINLPAVFSFSSFGAGSCDCV